MSRALTFVLMSVLMAGCAAILSNTEPLTAASIPLLAPFGPARHIEQHIVARWPDHEESFLCVLEMDRRHIAVVGMNAAGVTLFNLDFTGKEIHMDKSPLLPPAFSPEQILRDIQMAYWLNADIQKNLPNGWRLDDHGQLRRLSRENYMAYEIHYHGSRLPWPMSVDLNNPALKYRLSISTVKHEILPE
jgi:hypothetical protein